ncbi:MAG TPA: hypothetical protein GXX75_03785 [Clostridiales bacterium]|nr:hypothetical protein [Clostridiales bacterium]
MDDKQQAQELLVEIVEMINALQTLEESQKREIISKIEKVRAVYSAGGNVNDQ